MLQDLAGTQSSLTESHFPSLVREWLDYHSYNDTLPIFGSEHRQKGLVFPLLPIENRISKADILRNLTIHLTNGEGEPFFHLYELYISDSIRTCDEALRLEFYLNIYFAIHNLHPATTMSSKAQGKGSMEAFKQFLEEKGAQFSKSPEFLSYYALPYLPDPALHPSFSEIFTQAWIQDITRKAIAFCDTHINVKLTPRLTEMLDELKSLEHQHINTTQQLQSLQTHYHSLLSVASELVGTLAATFNGEAITTNYLSSIIHRLQSLRQEKIGTEIVGAQNVKQYYQPSYLNFDGIKRKLLASDIDNGGRPKQLLLNALRTRLLQAPLNERKRVLGVFIDFDLFNFRSGSPILSPLLTSGVDSIRDQTCRLLNVMASHYLGREYLVSSPSALSLLIAVFTREATDSAIQQHALGAIQKLSLRRKAQTTMNLAHIVPFLTHLLSDIDSLSDYSIEYATALMMNLCLRTLGKQDCVQQARGTLKVLTELLEHDSLHVKTYVNGILYSILSEPVIRNEARAMGMVDLLKYLRDVSGEPLTRQIDFVVQQLHSEIVPDISDTNSQDGADDDLEDEHEGDEDVLNAQELLEEVAPLIPGELVSGELLKREYSVSDEKSQGRKISQVSETIIHNIKHSNGAAIDMITRPQTPSFRAATPLPVSRPSSRLRMQAPSAASSRSASRASTIAEGLAKQSQKGLPPPSYKPPPPPGKANRPEMNSQELKEFTQGFSSRDRMARTPVGH